MKYGRLSARPGAVFKDGYISSRRVLFLPYRLGETQGLNFAIDS